MCGIAGIVNFNNKPVARQRLELMQQALAHRGPDDCGVYTDKNMGLAHARLSIIDLSLSGRQPMHNEDASISLVANGEIYNYQALRSSLIARGHRFSSDCDSEIIVHLYEEEGRDLIHQLNGMYAFCIYDQKRGIIFLVRDRIGIKPLYYYFDGQKFLFASEIKAILACPDINKTVDHTAISEYLTLSYVPSPRTAFQKIRKLKSAEYLQLDIASGRFTVQPYWDFRPGDQRLNEVEAAQRIRDLLSDSVRMRLISDVPLGAFLSGGIDSSIIVALMAKGSRARPKTFSIGFLDEPAFDETAYAQEVVEMYNTEHTEIKLKYEDVIVRLPHILNSFDEPFADSSALPTFIVSQATRGHVKVALSGDGGDELFAGYNKYLGMSIQRQPLLVPRMSGPLLSRIFAPALNNFTNPVFGRYKRRLKRMIDGLGRGDVNRHISWMRHLDQKEKEGLVNLRDMTAEGEIFDVISAYYSRFSNHWINKALYADLKLQLVDDMLTKVDRMSMLASLEVRVPFLDHRVAEQAFSLSASLKIRGGRRKYILLKAAKELLPRQLYRRPKRGFEVPIGPWFKKNKKFQQLFMDCMQTKGSGSIVNIDNAIKLFRLHCQEAVDYNRELWILFVLKWWSDRYL
jgi:asparagine synthase (glutamine-hydrolysing)